MLTAAKHRTLRVQRRTNIPSWNHDCKVKYDNFLKAAPEEAELKANEPINHLNESRRKRWEKAIGSIDFFVPAVWPGCLSTELACE